MKVGGGWKKFLCNVCLFYFNLFKILEGGKRKFEVENVVFLCLLFILAGIKIREWGFVFLKEIIGLWRKISNGMWLGCVVGVEECF